VAYLEDRGERSKWKANEVSSVGVKGKKKDLSYFLKTQSKKNPDFVVLKNRDFL
jgi:hypothetical protein